MNPEFILYTYAVVDGLVQCHAYGLYETEAEAEAAWQAVSAGIVGATSIEHMVLPLEAHPA